MYSLTSMSNTSTKNFHCDCCNFNTNFKSQYSKHLLTDKHKKRSTNHTQNPLMEKVGTNHSESADIESSQEEEA